MAKKKEIEKVIDIPYGMVLHTDGGSRNKGYSGFGIHGYIYSDQLPTKGAGNATNLLTNIGYVKKTEAKELSETYEYKEVKPLKYIDAYGSIEGITTNNVAELSGAVNALNLIRENPVKEALILTDSEMVVKGATGWLNTWESRNWIKSDGQPVANQQYWKMIASQIKSLQEDDIKVTFQWIKGHDDHLGNELADKLATIGVFNAIEGKIQTEVSQSPPEGYWTTEVDKHPLIANKRLYFCTLEHSLVPGEYYLGNHGKDDELIGKRMADGVYQFVKIPNPDPILEMVRLRQSKLVNNEDLIVMARLDKLYDKTTYNYLTNYGQICLYQPFPNRFDLHFVDTEPVTKVIKPPRLAIRAIEALNVLKGMLDQQLKDPTTFKETDITDQIYEIDNKQKLKLKPVFISGFTKFNVNVEYNNETNFIDVEITLGVDLPDRNVLKKLESYSPKVSVITWMESDQMLRYATIIKTNDGAVSIMAGYYSNHRFIFKAK